MNLRKVFLILVAFKFFKTTSSFIPKLNTDGNVKKWLIDLNDKIYNQYDKLGENKKYFERN